MRLSLYLARQATAKGEHSEALLHYFVVLKTVDEKTRYADFAAEFSDALAQQLSGCSDVVMAHGVWKNALELFPESALVHEVLARDAFHRGEVGEAIERFQNCIRLTVGNERVAHRMNLANFLFDAWHFPMINDAKRNAKFAEAIGKATSPGDLLFEIGSGTALLSLVAARITPNVISCEYNPILAKISREVRAQNGLSNRIQIIEERSFEIEISLKAQVILSETMDCCVFGEGTVATMLDAHRRIAAPNAKFIPEKATVFLALLSSESIHATHVAYVGDVAVCSTWVTQENSLSNRPEDRDPYWSAYLKDYPDTFVASDWTPALSVDFTSEAQLEDMVDSPMNGTLLLMATKEAKVHAIASAFSSRIYGDVTIDTMSDESCWPNGIYPLLEPLEMKPGDELAVSWTVRDGATRLEISIPERKRDIPHLSVFTQSNGEVLHLHDKAAQELLLAQIPEQTPCRVHDLTACVAVSYRIATERPSAKLSICQPDLSLLNLVMLKTEADVMIAPLQGEQDLILHWPFRLDGTLCKNSLDWVATARHYSMDATVFPGQFLAVGQLVFSDFLHNRSRPNPSSHLGFDLSPIAPFSLFEYRDIATANFPHTAMSANFELMPFSMDSALDTTIASEPVLLNRTLTTRVPVTSSGICDGVVYWWKVDRYESRSAGCNISAFIFPQRICVSEGDVLEVRADFYRGDLLVEAKKAE
ncbi:unnamed protein product, partial [Mesorhabditis spiculigera]